MASQPGRRARPRGQGAGQEELYQGGFGSLSTSGSFDVYNYVVQNIFIPCPKRRTPHTVLHPPRAATLIFSRQRRQTNNPSLPTAAATAASQPTTV